MVSEKQLMSVIKKSVPAVVSISAQQDIDDVTKKTPGIIFPLFERDARKSRRLVKKIEKGNLCVSGGSGFIVDKKGIVVTNMHVILEDHLFYKVTTSQGIEHDAELIATDIVGDVAFLQITSKERSFPTLPLGDSSSVDLGQYVVAIGNALGMFDNTVSFGIISGLSRSIEAKRGKLKEQLHGLLQTDAAINPGNSGGPLIDMQGNVIGINAASVFSAENIGFAIPVNAIKRDIKSIKKNGTIARPFLGVKYVVLNEENAKALGAPLHKGMYVANPYPGHSGIIHRSPAQRAGLKDGDIIVALNGKELTNTYTLQDALDTLESGSRISLAIRRGTKEFTAHATLESQ